MTKPVVLVLGATGLFGSLLAKRLVDQGRVDTICAGRNQAKLDAFCAANGGRSFAFDRDDLDEVARALEACKPFAVMDCAGPFQAYGNEPYQFAKTVIGAGCHYLDIADASEFVKGFSDIDEMAKSKTVVALSGASSTPAISSSVADTLTKDMASVESLTTIIIPGNKARRTLSVMRSILSQIGKPMRIRRYGKEETVLGWAETEVFDLVVEGKPYIKGRLASFVDTPDVALFPDRYKAQSVTFKAGLEIKLFHYALVAGRWLVSKGVVKSLEPYTKAVRWIASWFEGLGSDAGGMKMSILGRKKDGTYERCEWDLIADDGQGPNIPTLPVSILLNRILDNEVETGARACLGEITLDELDEALATIGGETQIHKHKALPIFKQALGDDFEHLAKPIKDLHNGLGRHVYKGQAQIKGPTGIMGHIASKLVGFPIGNGDVPVEVTLTADEKSETWIRDFGGKRFLSHLSLDNEGFIQERFGPLSIRLGLKVQGDKLLYPVARGRLFGIIPFPLFLMPVSISHEEVDEEGRFVFDVLLKFRFGGRIAHYRGWLVQQD